MGMCTYNPVILRVLGELCVVYGCVLCGVCKVLCVCVCVCLGGAVLVHGARCTVHGVRVGVGVCVVLVAWCVQVQRMIRGVGNVFFSTYPQTLNG